MRDLSCRQARALRRWLEWQRPLRPGLAPRARAIRTRLEALKTDRVSHTDVVGALHDSPRIDSNSPDVTDAGRPGSLPESVGPHKGSSSSANSNTRGPLICAW